MKTPDEIKKGLVYCISPECAGEKCPYYYAKSCNSERTYDVLAYIQQLEEERDAAIRDITEIVQEYGEPYCEYCGAEFKPNCTGHCWTHNEGFKWRGVQKE